MTIVEYHFNDYNFPPGQYSFGDMVQIDPQTVGVIVQIQKETFQVLNMHGKVVSMRSAALQKKREKKAAAALDSEQNAIQVCRCC